MRTLVAIVVVCAIFSSELLACPEVVVPLDRKDTALRSVRWKRPLQTYKRRKYKPALQSFRRTARALNNEIQSLFHPAGDPAANRTIQRWLQRHLYTRHPSILESTDGFTYPVLVWWAWADSACRRGEYQEAQRALDRLASLRPSSDVFFHQAVVALRRQDWDKAEKLLNRTRPDRYLTPFVEGVLAGARGDAATAATKLRRAADAAYLEERRQAALKALERWGAAKPGDDS